MTKLPRPPKAGASATIWTAGQTLAENHATLAGKVNPNPFSG